MGRGGNRRRVDRSSEPGRARLVLLRLRALAPLATRVALAVALSAGGIHGWRSLCRAEALRIRGIKFTGLVHASSDELLALSPVRRGDAFLLADLGAMRAALARHPWLEEVEVRRSWPPSVVVTVRERKATALVDLGGLYLVDDAGNVFKRAAARDGLDLPLVTGIGRADYVQRRAAVEPLLQGALTLVRTWRESGRELTARLSEIHVDAVEGSTLYVGDDGMQIRLGAGDVPAKLARLDRILAALRAEGKKAEVLHLDNRVHPSWVTVRLASAEPPRSGR